MPLVEWVSWSQEAFDRARGERKPVLLSIAAPWCQWCRQMDATSYADPQVAATINERFVPIRVDAARRPDISSRYTLGGWPTIAFLTADGYVVTGGTYLDRDRIARVLESVLHAFATRETEITTNASAASLRQDDTEEASAGAKVPPDAESLADAVYETFDDEHGGFGIAPKFPVVAPLHLALASYAESGERDMARVAAFTLDRMAAGSLRDRVDGGFFRCCATRDWQQPQVEKLLDVNASLLRLYASAAVLPGFEFCRNVAADVVRYVQTWLADPLDAGWYGSQAGSEEYYAAGTVEGRQGLVLPAIDRVLYVDANAAMISASLQAGRLLDDASLGEFAVKSLERVLLTCYRPGKGVAHDFDGTPGIVGLLEDQVATAAACLDAHEATNDIVYEMMAEELMHYSARTMWDAVCGGFFDRAEPEADEIGLMRRRVKPFACNADAVVVLRRLAASSGDAEFNRLADETLAVIASRAAHQGPLAAHYLLAARRAEVR